MVLPTRASNLLRTVFKAKMPSTIIIYSPMRAKEPLRTELKPAQTHSRTSRVPQMHRSRTLWRRKSQNREKTQILALKINRKVSLRLCLISSNILSTVNLYHDCLKYCDISTVIHKFAIKSMEANYTESPLNIVNTYQNLFLPYFRCIWRPWKWQAIQRGDQASW